MNRIREEVLDRLISGEKILNSYPAQEKDLVESLNQLVIDGRNGSVLIIGPRGSGKTTFVNECFKKLENPAKITRINLNGFLHNSDVAAMKELASRLGNSIDTDTDDEAFVAQVVKDLLKPIRHPSIIVLEEFDAFAIGRSAEKQSFLYSLLDAANNKIAQLFVIGITSHTDVLDALEKRVRSRISQKPILLQFGWTLETYLDHAENLLLLDVEKGNKTMHVWNQQVKDLLSNPDVQKCLEYHYASNCSLGRLRQYLISVIALADMDTLNPDVFKRANEELFTVNHRQITLQGLSDLELCILTAAKQCLDIYGDVGDLNFELIDKEYRSFAKQKKRTSNVPLYSKSVTLQVFDKLCDLGIFVPIKTRSQMNTLRQFQPVKLQLDKSMIKDCVQKGNRPTYFNEWLHSG